MKIYYIVLLIYFGFLIGYPLGYIRSSIRNIK